MKLIYAHLALMIICFSSNSCKKLIEVDSPHNQLTQDKIYSDSTSTVALLVNAYALLNETIDINYTPQMGMYADELSYTAANPETQEFLDGSVSPNSNANLNIWKNNYFLIYECNDIINQLKMYHGINAASKTQIGGEARFLRAYAYFYLINTFGQVPLILETDVNTTAGSIGADSATVYHQIVSDLIMAQDSLSINYVGQGRIRANKLAATALLSRVYLYQKNYAAAETASSILINSGLYNPLEVPSLVFLANNNDAILQIYTQYGFVSEAQSFVPNGGKPTFPLSNTLLASFEPGDFRRIAWVDSSVVSGNGTGTTFYFPYKYHNNNTNLNAPEYLSALRIAEQYLIRAEARAQSNNISGAVVDLNVIRTRAGLSAFSTNISLQVCMDKIIHERQVELFAEWGSRYLDLKRTGRLNPLMMAIKAAWKPTNTVLPIPQNEITYDPYLKQNPGY